MSALNRHAEIESLDQFLAHDSLHHCIVQGVDFLDAGVDWDALDVRGCVFLGCRFEHPRVTAGLVETGALVFPALPDLPYRPYRSTLYTWKELMEGYDEVEDRSVDKQIYDHMLRMKSPSPDLLEALAQRIHDHAIDDALADFLYGGPEDRRMVGLMGGHGTRRDDPVYRSVAEIARELTRLGYTMVSGGGPGIMEATNLGAWLAPHPDDRLEEALELLAPSPSYADPGFVKCARDVLERVPQGAESLAVPTWFYGHEPSNLFATHIAKYFANSLREDGLLAIAIHGVIYAPGSAGTLQEAFMDLCQNHYTTFEWTSPMVFFGEAFFRDEVGLWPMLETFTAGRPYRDYLALLDSPEDIVHFIESHPPRKPS